MDRIEETIRRITLNELKETKYLYRDYLIGCFISVLYKAGIPKENPINPNYIEAFIDSFHESFYGGCEPEFETEEQYERYLETLRMLREDFVWSCPRYSFDLNEYLFGNNGRHFPILININLVQRSIKFLQDCWCNGETYCYQNSHGRGEKMWKLTKEFFN